MSLSYSKSKFTYIKSSDINDGSKNLIPKLSILKLFLAYGLKIIFKIKYFKYKYFNIKVIRIVNCMQIPQLTQQVILIWKII